MTGALEASAMRYLLALLVVLLLSGCTKETPPPVSGPATPSPEATATPDAPAQAETPTAASPVEQGGTMVFHDASGISISYPKQLHFENDPAFLGVVKDEAQSQTGLDIPESVGVRFLLFADPPGTVKFNANLNAVVEQVSPQAGDLNSQQYAEITIDQLKSAFSAEVASPLEATEISGTEFQTADYTYTMPNQTDTLRGRFYIHYDEESRKAYALTLTALEENYQEKFKPLEEAVKSVEID